MPPHDSPRNPDRSGIRRLAARLTRPSELTLQRRILRAGVFLVVLIFLGIALWPTVKSHLQSYAVLQLVAGKPLSPQLAALVTEPIVTTEADFQTPSGTVRARSYLPVNHPNAPGMVVLHGVHHLGIEEPRMRSLATAIASCGVRVLTPELPGIKDYHVDSASIRTIGESTQWLAKQTGAPVGVLALSFSGGLALVAAADPAYRPSFRFVFAIGSQDSLPRVAQYFRTGEDARPDGSIEKLAAHEYGPLVLEYEYIEDYVPAPDVPALKAVLRAHLYEDGPAEKLAIAALTPAQVEETKALLNASLPATHTLLAASAAKHNAEMVALSPSSKLRTLTTPVYLLHGQGDNIIPAAETLWMASELPPHTLKAALVSPILSHVNFDGGKPTLGDQWRLLHFFALVMQAAGD
ncbi:Dienelactone hydrolase [Granulicella rosea]|uniref:Dienelactone hydrolase n=1 Tax=Granulicella rosea TaxID=474952 RepID=A0A239CQQ4_9BACT|nr:alpha/beta hydrolase [Granulicella rosea]SNS22182.1 Dienelactone hydrolase [Granulicella rosea]